MKACFLFLILFVYACATIKAPSGGDKDETPPHVLYTSPDSAALNVNTRVIEIQFDEYVKTLDANKLIIISPNPDKNPEFVIKKKSLLIKFSDSLRPNTTYNILLNGGVVDVNEGNALEDYRLTFSTGNYLDSMSYSALVIDAYTRKACDHCAIFLYSELKDSQVLNNKPDYLSRTRGTGLGTASFLPKDSFLVYAIEDENKNLRLDIGEKISLGALRFTDSTYTDSFYLFPYFGNKSPLPKPLPNLYPGVFKFSLDRTYYGDKLKVYYKTKQDPEDSTFIPVLYNYSRDTITCYISTKELDTGTVFIQIDSLVRDYRYQVAVQDKRKKLLTYSFTEPGKITLHSKQLVDSVDSKQIILISDSQSITLDSFQIEAERVYLYFNHKSAVGLILKENAIEDINGTKNQLDSTRLTFTNADPAILSLKLQLADSFQYLLQILKDDRVVYQVQTGSNYSHVFRNLQPGNYRIRVITDLNQNHIWDPGNIFSGTPPEPVFLSESVELRPSWDKELLINSL